MWFFIARRVLYAVPILLGVSFVVFLLMKMVPGDAADIRRAHEVIVDDAAWLFIVHDLNPRAMTKHVKGFVSAQSWFQDFTHVYME